MKPERRHFLQESNYRLAVWSERLAPLWRFLLAVWAPRPTERSSWRRGLLLGADHIGDVLYLTPSLDRLREAFPACRWDICVSPPADQVLVTNPNLSEVIAVPHEQTLRSLWKLRPLLKERRYDVIFCYDAGRSWKDLLLALSVRIPNRIGYAYKGFSSWLTVPIPAPEPFPQPCAGYTRNLVAQATGTAPDWPLTPRIAHREEDAEAVRALWGELALPAGKPVLLCFATSRQSRGGWPPEHIAATLRALDPDERYEIVWAGAAGDRDALRALQATLGRPSREIAGRLNLRALRHFMEGCRAVVTVDSGQRHIANAAGTPVFFCRNLIFPRVVSGKYCQNETDLLDAEEFFGTDLSEVWRSHAPEELARRIARGLAARSRGSSL